MARLATSVSRSECAVSDLFTAASPMLAHEGYGPLGSMANLRHSKEIYSVMDGMNVLEGLLFLELNRVKTLDNFLTLSVPQFFINRKEMMSRGDMRFGSNH